MGVAPSRLLGRVPAEWHEHFDADGVRTGVTVVHREPEFTVSDWQLLVASGRLELELGPYGIPYDEALNPASQFAYEAPEKPVTNWAVKAAEDAKERYYKNRPKGESRNGHMWDPPKRRS